MQINNLPEYALDYKYIVVRSVEGELWFWGAWNDELKAESVAFDIDGICISRDTVAF